MSPWLELLPEPHCCRAYVSSSSNWPTLDGIPCSSPQEAMKNTCMDCIDDICTVHTPLCSENAKYVLHNQWKADSCIFSPFERLDPGKGLKRWLCFYILWTWKQYFKMPASTEGILLYLVHYLVRLHASILAPGQDFVAVRGVETRSYHIKIH